MADGEWKNGILDGDQHLILTVYHAVKALEATKDLSHDMKRIIAELGAELSKMSILDEGEAGNDRVIEDRLASARDTIVRLHSSHSKIWDSGPSIVLEYLKAVDEVRVLTEDLESITTKKNRKMKELVDQTQSILQTAMVRLQEELIHILAQNKQCFEHEYVSLPVCEEDPMYDESIVSCEDNSLENVSQRVSSSTETEEYLMDLVHPDVIPQIKSIARIMFASRYSQEFCLTFVKFWRHAFNEYLATLNMGRFSITDVLKMEWVCLNSKIKKWCVAMKSIFGVYFSSAKRLFDQVLGEYGCASSICLVEASTASVLCLVDFGQAVALGPHGPEWLFSLLKMYDVLVALIPDMEVLYPEEAGLMFKVEFHELLLRIGASAKVVFREFGNHIESSISTTPFVSGGVHPLTKYVVNYIVCFAGYCDPMDSLLEDRSVMTDYLLSFTSILEANLDNKSNLYNDFALKHIFLMNNICYMVQKVCNSKIRSYFGDEWIRSRMCVYRQHAMCYERATWSTILPLLRDDRKAGKATLKARYRAFATAFEDVYKNQTGWSVPDPKLREELRISVSKTVIHAYRGFVDNITNSIGEKHIKYTEQDLGTYILDLFEGSPKPLNHSPKR